MQAIKTRMTIHTTETLGTSGTEVTYAKGGGVIPRSTVSGGISLFTA